MVRIKKKEARELREAGVRTNTIGSEATTRPINRTQQKTIGSQVVSKEEFEVEAGRGGTPSQVNIERQKKDIELGKIKKDIGLAPDQTLRPAQVQAFKEGTEQVKTAEELNRVNEEFLARERDKPLSVKEEQTEILKAGLQVVGATSGIAGATTLAGTAIGGPLGTAIGLGVGIALNEVKNAITGKGDINTARQSITNYGQAGNAVMDSLELGQTTYLRALGEISNIENDLLKTEREIQKMSKELLKKEKARILYQDVLIQKQNIANQKAQLRNVALSQVAEQARGAV